MFGHPGIATFEYSGKEPLATGHSKKKKTRIGKTSPATTADSPTPPTTASDSLNTTAELEEPSPAVQEASSQQRPRGPNFFMNHTPREFEMARGRTQELPRAQSDFNFSRPSTAGNKPGGSLPNFPQRLPDSPVSIGSPNVHPALRQPDMDDTTGFSEPEDTVEGSIEDCERVRRKPKDSLQTYYSHQKLLASICRNEKNRNYTPLEPLVAQYQNKRNYTPLEPVVAQCLRADADAGADEPSQEDLDAIAEASTYRAYQEYFDVQEPGPVSSQRNRASGGPPNIPLPASPVELDATLPESKSSIADTKFTLEPTSYIPNRDPSGTLRSSTAPTLERSGSVGILSSCESDFVAAAHGEYSPYDGRLSGSLSPPKRGRVQVAPVGSSKLGRMAPPIPGHDALTATAQLNDLSYYLKNTGPAPPPDQQKEEELKARQQKKKGFKMFKTQKSLAEKYGSVEGSPSVARVRAPSIPACAREMTTISGAKHLKIVIPSDGINSHTNSTFTMPVTTVALDPGRLAADAGSSRRSVRISVTFTDEMLCPLGSPKLENYFQTAAIDGEIFGSVGDRRRKSLKTSPVVAKGVKVKDHPLANHEPSRQEITRARKLRDLQRMKARAASSSSMCSPSPTQSVETIIHRKESSPAPEVRPPEHSPEPEVCTPARNSPRILASPAESAVEEEENSCLDINILRLEQRVFALERQNTDLAEALARAMGMGFEEVDAEEVLIAYRRMLEA